MAYAFSDWQAGVIPPKGWDGADAVDDGWTKAEIDAFIRETVKPADEAIAIWRKRGLLGQEQKPPGPPADTPPDKPRAPAPNPEPDDDLVPMPAKLISPHGTIPLKRNDKDCETEEIPPVLNRGDPLPSARALVAARFVADDLRTLHHWRGSFYRWDGASYQGADTDAVNAVIWQFLERAFHFDGKDTKSFQPTRSRVGDVFAALAAACNLPAHIEAPTWLAAGNDMPPANEFLAVKNGLLHLPSGDLYPPAPTFFGLNSAGTAYDPDAPEPVEWLRFLRQIWPDDASSINTLQDLFGYLMSPDTSQQKIGLVVGPKRSGKGTIQRVIAGLLGQDSVSAPTLASLATNFGLAPLIGKSVGIIGDARLSSRADQAAITERLLSVSGEDSITIDRKHISAWTGRLGIRFLIMTNELPRLADASGALASRFVVLTMERSFYGIEDRGLANRLLAELPGILNWALAGYLRLRQRGHFLQPDSARDAIADLEALGSPVAAFVKDCCTVAPGLQCAVGGMYDAWVRWCEANGRKEPGTAATFGRDLRAAVSGLKVRKTRDGSSRLNVYEGISVATTATSLSPNW